MTFDGIKCEESPIPHEENVMSPDPIVSLKKIIGYSG